MASSQTRDFPHERVAVNSLPNSPRRSLNERHLVDFLQSCDAVAHLGESGIAQEGHAVPWRRA